MPDLRALVLRAPAPDRLPHDDDDEALRALVEEVTRLDLDLETLAATLAEFSVRYERALAEVFQDLGAAERLLGRLRGLEGGLYRLAEALDRGDLDPGDLDPGDPAAPAAGAVAEPAAPPPAVTDAAADDTATAGAPSGPEPGAPPDAATAAQAAAGADLAAPAIKRLYRRLARLLHPDLGPDGDRDRLSELMARANAAYARGDLTSLTILAEQVGAGDPAGDLTPEERGAYRAQRMEALSRIASSLAREREQLLRSDTRRLWEDAHWRGGGGGGGDPLEAYFEDTRRELREEEAAAYAEVVFRMEQLARAAANLTRARESVMANIVKTGPGDVARAFDPLRETALVRLAASRLGRRRAGPAARELAQALETTAAGAPWEAALTLLAFFAEDAGARPPDALQTPAAWGERWQTVRAAWPAAPELPRLLAHLPRHLTLGARRQGDDVVAGPQLASEDLVEGVRLALANATSGDDLGGGAAGGAGTPLARVARTVLADLGPRGACAVCGPAVGARHLLRTRGLDEQHGLVCCGCGAVLRSYWRYGAVEGLEALAPHALALGLVSEVTAALGGTTIGFQLLPDERRALTAEALCRRFAQLYLAPNDLALAAEAITLWGPAGALSAGAPLPGEGLRFAVAGGAGTTAEELLELLRVRIERRFRP
jgi:curved DNA-binding protein CbpA